MGHVDSAEGPAVFYRLTGVKRGDVVNVVRTDGSVAAFTISKVTVVERTAFPSKAVFGPTARPAIRLITCVGPFDTSTGKYVNTLIAWGRAAP